jgi:hypothetical protein
VLEIAGFPGGAGIDGSPASPLVASPGQSVVIEGVRPAVGDPVELALADALMRATGAGEWSTVELLGRELAARREARAGVVDLAAERKRRGGGS